MQGTEELELENDYLAPSDTVREWEVNYEQSNISNRYA
jgi:hypothetical protein